MLKERIEQDLKTALREGDKARLSVLRSLKSAITYAEVAKGAKAGPGLSDSEVEEVLAKEAKKRQESADAYVKVGERERADTELQEKGVIGEYLPQALSVDEVESLVNEAIAEIGAPTPQTMGQIIGEVKRRAGAGADGSVIAQIVKERM